jgi:hypothetical protein
MDSDSGMRPDAKAHAIIFMRVSLARRHEEEPARGAHRKQSLKF